MTTSDPFDDPRVQGLINALCAIYGVTREELVLSVRGDDRGGDLDPLSDTAASKSLPADE